MSEDAHTLQGVKGIGAKTAQRIVIDLVTRWRRQLWPLKVWWQLRVACAEAHSALTTLGITAKQAENILNKLLKSNPNATTEELVRQALQML